MPSELLTERHDRTLLLTRSGAAHDNPLSAQLCAADVEALGTAESDDSIAAIVLQGDGPHFCSGLDPQADAADRDACEAWVPALQACPKPVLAALEVRAVGAGLLLALGCDLLVAAREATMLAALHPDQPGWESSAALLALREAGVPRHRLATLAALGDGPSAGDLQRWGLACRLTERSRAAALALEPAARLADRGAGWAEMKEALRSSGSSAWSAA